MSQDLASKVVLRIINALSESIPVGRMYDDRKVAGVAAVLFGENDEDVKGLRGIAGPVAESVAYLEKASGDFLLIFPDSRRYDMGPYAIYTAAIFDKPGDYTTARCVTVTTNHLKTKCEAISINDIPLNALAALYDVLNRKDEPGTWDKKYVGGELSPDLCGIDVKV